MTSGLEKMEVRALSHALRQSGVPPQAAPFIELLRQRVLSFGPAVEMPSTAATTKASNGPIAPPPIVKAGGAPPPPPPPPPPPSAAVAKKSASKAKASPESGGGGGRGLHLDELNQAVLKRRAAAETEGGGTEATPREARERDMRRRRFSTEMGSAFAKTLKRISTKSRASMVRSPHSPEADERPPPVVVPSSPEVGAKRQSSSPDGMAYV